ncbi:hypothetical protein BDR05DRAFT_950685 [Suillus weaverae]|nr:hypothetical protein BDR05DRAFT_950685 [Suillus weaverae]
MSTQADLKRADPRPSTDSQPAEKVSSKTQKGAKITMAENLALVAAWMQQLQTLTLINLCTHVFLVPSFSIPVLYTLPLRKPEGAMPFTQFPEPITPSPGLMSQDQYIKSYSKSLMPRYPQFDAHIAWAGGVLCNQTISSQYLGETQNPFCSEPHKKSKKMCLQLLAEQMTQLQQEISSLQCEMTKCVRDNNDISIVVVKSWDCDSSEDENKDEQDEDMDVDDNADNDADDDVDNDVDNDVDDDADNDADNEEDKDDNVDDADDDVDDDVDDVDKDNDADENKDEDQDDQDQDQDQDGDETLTNDGIQDKGTANREASDQEEGHEHVPPCLLKLSRKQKMVTSSDEEAEPIQPPPQKKQATIQTANEDLPTVCPSDGCNDIMPSHPSGMVLVKYKAFQHCLQMLGGEFSRQMLKLEMELCAAIQSDLQCKRWLSEINYFAVHHSVLKLEPDLCQLIFDKAMKDKCIIYPTLLTNLLEQDYGVELNKQLAFLAHLKIFDVGHPIFNKARPGYYGPKGSAVFPSQLIADDWGFIDNQLCTLQQAFKLMVASADSGDALQGIDKEGKDEQFDDILMKIMLKQVTELDYLPAATSQPTALVPQQGKGQKKIHDDFLT